MQYTMELARDGRVVLITIENPLDENDILDSYRRTQQEVYGKADRIVYMIVDARKVTKLPPNILSILKRVRQTSHPMGGDVIVVTENRFVATIGKLMGKIIPSMPTQIVNGIDEAWMFTNRLIQTENVIARSG